MFSLYFNTKPVALSLGWLDIRWYSLMYLSSVAAIYLLLLWRIKRKESSDFFGKSPQDKVFDFLALTFLGAIIGARLGYAIFFNLDFFLQHPFSLFNPFENGRFQGLFGMSFHGGLIGALLFAWIFSQKNNLSFFKLADFVVPAVPLGYFWGRIGNFLNGEILGGKNEGAFSVTFSSDPLAIPRHPIQIYEALGEGILIFCILWPLRNNKIFQDKLLGTYMVLYAAIRFFLEFLRQPEKLSKGGLTTAQILCLIMLAAGILLMALVSRTEKTKNKSPNLEKL